MIHCNIDYYYYCYLDQKKFLNFSTLKLAGTTIRFNLAPLCDIFFKTWKFELT